MQQTQLLFFLCHPLPARASNRARQAIISPTWSTRRRQIRLLTCPEPIDTPSTPTLVSSLDLMIWGDIPSQSIPVVNFFLFSYALSLDLDLGQGGPLQFLQPPVPLKQLPVVQWTVPQASNVLGLISWKRSLNPGTVNPAANQLSTA